MSRYSFHWRRGRVYRIARQHNYGVTLRVHTTGNSCSTHTQQSRNCLRARESHERSGLDKTLDLAIFSCLEDFKKIGHWSLATFSFLLEEKMIRSRHLTNQSLFNRTLRLDRIKRLRRVNCITSTSQTT